MKRIKSNKQLVIIGAGGHGLVVADAAARTKRWDRIVFLDDKKSEARIPGAKIAGKTERYPDYVADHDIIIAIGENTARGKIFEKIEKAGATIPVIVHPSAIVSANTVIGIGTVVMAGAIINCFSRIGKGCIINTGATIDHDNTIEDIVHVSPGVHLGGAVHIGKYSWIGIGATIINDINIVSNCIVGAGAVVTEDIADPDTYVGIPARKIRRRTL